MREGTLGNLFIVNREQISHIKTAVHHLVLFRTISGGSFSSTMKTESDLRASSTSFKLRRNNGGGRRLIHWISLVAVFMTAFAESSRAASLGACPETCTGDCVCPSVSSPGGLGSEQTPQFIVLYTDELVTESMFRRIIDITIERRNSNGCDIPITWYVRSQQSDPDIIRNAYNRYFEVAISAASEVGNPGELMQFAKRWLTEEAGIPNQDVKGFRSPVWSNAVPARDILHEIGLEYDNSIVEPIGPVSASPTLNSRLWPYSLDDGIVQDCSSTWAKCDANERHQGVMEVPVWLMEDLHGNNLYDPFVRSDWASILRYNFESAYRSNRAPLAIGLSSRLLEAPESTLAEFSAFVEYALSHEDVWFVTNAQLVNFMKSPKEARMVHEILGCGGRPADKQCFPPNGGCGRGTYDYAACRCACEHGDNPIEDGACVDSDGRCTVAKEFDSALGEYFCRSVPQQSEEDSKKGLFSKLNASSGMLIGLFCLLALIAVFGLFKGLRTGRSRAHALENGDTEMVLAEEHSRVRYGTTASY